MFFSPWGPVCSGCKTAASLCSLLPAQIAPRDLGDNSQPVDIHDWHAVPQSRLQTGMRGAREFQSSGQEPTLAGRRSIHTKLQNKGQIEASTGQVQFLATRRSTSPRSRIYCFTQMNLKPWWQKAAHPRWL